jgi:hypothetical protein
MTYVPWEDAAAVRPLPVGSNMPVVAAVLAVDGGRFDLGAAVAGKPTILIRDMLANYYVAVAGRNHIGARIRTALSQGRRPGSEAAVGKIGYRRMHGPTNTYRSVFQEKTPPSTRAKRVCVSR